jgi:protease-4
MVVGVHTKGDINMGLQIPRRGRIALVQMFGSIGGAIRTAEYVPILEGLRRNEAIKSVVLDLDSPGGEVTASAYLHLATSKLSEKKPVIAFVRGTCASGAYLIATGARRIVAMPHALIGSIGAISVWPVVSELMERLGVQVEVSKSGSLKDMHAFWRPATDEERAMSQALIEDFHRSFVKTVAKARHIDPERVEALATGEMFWAKKALEMGLVDELDDLERAVELAMEMGQVPRRIVTARPRRRRWRRWIDAAAHSLVNEVSLEAERRVQSRFSL